MNEAVCVVPVSPLRSDCTHQSEMVSQLQFGEFCAITGNVQADWVKVKCFYDGYVGWCQQAHLQKTLDRGVGPGPEVLTRRWVSRVEYNGQPMHLPLGSLVAGIRRGRWNGAKMEVRPPGGLWYPAKARRSARTIRPLALMFLNTPYLWGGKTVFGTDCSGLTQTIFRFFNLPLMRDASQQATQGEGVKSITNARCGDLAFFGQEPDRITHVGLMLNATEIIHASGKVKLDDMDSKGIIDRTSHKHTHLLRSIRRFF
jgi:gamma-D-glutamyl-L-lysine dipeptidyl-peptidase